MYESVKAKIEAKYGSVNKLSKLLGIASNDMYCAFAGTKPMFPMYKVLIAHALGERMEDLFFDVGADEKLRTRETEQKLTEKYSRRVKIYSRRVKMQHDMRRIEVIDIIHEYIQKDMQVCEVHGWDKTKFIHMIRELLDDIEENKED